MTGIHDGKPQFHLRTHEWTFGRRAVVADQPLSDPFVTHTVVVRGLRAALAVLFRRYKLVMHVDGTPMATRAVFTADYTEPPPGPPRAMSLDDGCSGNGHTEP